MLKERRNRHDPGARPRQLKIVEKKEELILTRKSAIRKKILNYFEQISRNSNLE